MFLDITEAFINTNQPYSPTQGFTEIPPGIQIDIKNRIFSPNFVLNFNLISAYLKTQNLVIFIYLL